MQEQKQTLEKQTAGRRSGKKQAAGKLAANRRPGKKQAAGKQTAGGLTAKKLSTGKQAVDSRPISGKKEEKTRDGFFCPVEKKCGGCSLLTVPYREQLVEKQKQVAELLRPFCPVEPVIGMEKPLHYRNKVHAVFGRKKDGSIISGTYEANTHRIVPVDSCLIENEKADEIIWSIRELARSFRFTIYDEDQGRGFLRHILVRTGHASGQIMVVLVTGTSVFPSKKNFIQALLALHPQITTIVQNINDLHTSMILGEREIVLYGPGYIEDKLCGLTFRISSASFYQVNSLQTEKLYSTAVQMAGLTGKERVIDAYSGIGTIGLIAASSAKEIISVELNPDAVHDAIINAKSNHIKNIRFYKADASMYITQMARAGERADVVFMDPPRSGSTQTFLKAAAGLGPERIVYISCNPQTLARDLKWLEKLGYQAQKAVPVDMFCFTEHIETVCLLTHSLNFGA